MALAWLESKDAARAREVARKVVGSKRFSTWAQITRDQIRTLAGEPK